MTRDDLIREIQAQFPGRILLLSKEAAVVLRRTQQSMTQIPHDKLPRVGKGGRGGAKITVYALADFIMDSMTSHGVEIEDQIVNKSSVPSNLPAPVKQGIHQTRCGEGI